MARTKKDTTRTFQFDGFDPPESNYFKMPNQWTDITAQVDNLAELKVVEYVLRHTWGFQEFGISKHIANDEFVGGRKRRDGSRLDRGTGLSLRAVRDGINKAVEHGLLEEMVDDTDRGRVRKFYCLRMSHPDQIENDEADSLEKSGGQSLPPPRQSLHARQANFDPRTEKETREIHLEETHPHNSNGFDLETQVFKNETLSKFSKKRDSEIQNSASAKKPEPIEPGRGASSFQPVSQVLASRGVGTPPQTGSVAAKNSSESAADPATGSRTDPDAEPAPKRPRGRPRSYPVPPDLELFTRDISAEFHDASKLPSNLSFIGRVLHESGLPSSVLYQLMQEARQITKGKGNIEKPSADEPAFRNRVPYWKKTLLDLIEKEGRVVSARRQPPGRQGREAP